MERIEKLVDVALSDAEHRLKAQRLAQVRRARVANDDQKKVWATTFKHKDEELKLEELELVETIETGCEKRPITCYAKPDYTRGVVEIVREDMIDAETGDYPQEAIVETRTMSTTEKQQRLPLPEPKLREAAEPVVGESSCEQCGSVDGHKPDCTRLAPPAPEVATPVDVTVTISQEKQGKPPIIHALPSEISDMLLRDEDVLIAFDDETWSLKLLPIEIAGLRGGHVLTVNMRLEAEDAHGPYYKLQPVQVSGKPRTPPPAAAPEAPAEGA